MCFIDWQDATELNLGDRGPTRTLGTALGITDPPLVVPGFDLLSPAFQL